MVAHKSIYLLAVGVLGLFLFPSPIPAVSDEIELSLVCQWSKAKITVGKPTEKIEEEDAGYEEEKALSSLTVLNIESKSRKMLESRWLSVDVSYSVIMDDVEISGSAMGKESEKFRVRTTSGSEIPAFLIQLSINRTNGSATRSIIFPTDPDRDIGMLDIEHYGVCEKNEKKF